MKKVEEKFGNKAHYNSEREPIHFTALPFGFFRVSLSLSLSSFLFGFILLISLLFFLLCTFVCPTDWVRQSKRRILISLFYLFPRHVPATPHPPSLLLYNPLLLAFSIEISHKKGIKAEASVDCELLFWHFFKAEHALPHLSCLCPFSLFSLFSAHSLPSHSELINNFFLSSFSVSLPLVGTLKLATNLRVIAAFCIFYDFCSASSRFVLMNHGYVGYNLVLIAFCWHLCCQRHAILLMSKWGPIYDIIIERYHCV